MITGGNFIQIGKTEMSEAAFPAAQDVGIDAFPAANARFENTISELTKERDELKGRVSSLKAQLEETENGQAEAMTAAFQRVVAEIRAELLGAIAVQGSEIAELRKELAPLRAEREARLEAERIALEKHQQERKEAALLQFIYLRNNGWVLTQQVEYIQSMNPEEIDYVLREKGRFSNISNMIRRIAAEGWDKERLLQPWR